MPIVANDPVPAEIEAVIKRREELELDHRDEVWEGVLHMNPPASVEHQRTAMALIRLIDACAQRAGLDLAPEVGIGDDAHNYRTPDLVLLRPDPAPQWNPTAALVVEILSPRDIAWEKLDFYADHNIDELLYVDLEKHEVTWMALHHGEYQRTERSALIDLGVTEVASHLGWG